MKGRDLTLLTDLYQLTMMQGYYNSGLKNKDVIFDLFYRVNPCGNGFAIAAGLEQAIEYLENLSFNDENLDYLKGLGRFDYEFIEYLRDFKFTGEVWAIPEGSVVFPQEPLLRIKAPIIEAQLIETALLNIINHQSLIATKASRVVRAAGGDKVLEFGLRRAQGPDAGVYGSRAAIIAGCHATSNVLAGQKFGVPVSGTHAHSWVMSFPDELTAFREYAKVFPESCTLLVDTYDTLKSGVPNAIKVFQEMRSNGIELKNYGVRLDSGDFAYLSKKTRAMLNTAGFEDAFISASSDLDENLIVHLKLQGAQITQWGVGTRLITSDDCPSFGGVYKLAAEFEDNGKMIPKIKLSENPVKVTNPGIKKVIRLYDKDSGKAKADLITLEEEAIDTRQDLTIFDPLATCKTMTLKKNSFQTREMLVPVIREGKTIYSSPSVMEIRDYCLKEQNSLWDEHKRLINPQTLPVDLSQKLYDLKQHMIKEIREE